MTKTQALCSQRGPDGLNEADHQLAEIRASQRCEELAVEMLLDDVWETLGNTAAEGFWKGAVVVDRNLLSIFWHRVKVRASGFVSDTLETPSRDSELSHALKGIRETYEDAAAEKILNEET